MVASSDPRVPCVLSFLKNNIKNIIVEAYYPDQKSVLAYKIEEILKSLELEKVNQNKERTIPSMVKDQKSQEQLWIATTSELKL